MEMRFFSGTRIEFIEGSRRVVLTRNSGADKWNARLYVNDGDTATLVSAKFRTVAKAEKWAARVMR